MYAEWTKHLPHEPDKKDWERDIKGSKRILDHLLKLLREREAGIDRSELDPKVYDQQPNWAYKQADKNGRRAELHYLTKLIDLDQQKD